MKIKALLTQKRVPRLGTEKTPDFQTPLLHRRRAMTHQPLATSSSPGRLYLSL
jgi:hypothetical protein